MKTNREKKFNKPVILIKILDDDTLLVVDATTTIRFLNKETLEVIGGFKANINHLRYKNSVVAFSSDGGYFSSLSEDRRQTKLYNAKTKKTVAVMDRHIGLSSCTGIDALNKYMYSCGEDGKTFATDIKSGRLAFTMPVHSDAVNDIAFSSNGNWIATAGYDKNISLFNLATMTPKHRLKAHSAPVMKMKFLSKNRLVSIDKRNVAIIWNIYSGKIITRLSGVHDDVTQMVVGGDDKFLFLGTSLGYILIYELENYQQLSKKYVKIDSAITALEFDETLQHLIVASDNGDIFFYDIFEGEHHIKTLLQNKEYSSIQRYVDENPLLAYTKVYYLVSNLWDRTLEKATLCLQNGDKKTAISLFSHFKNVPVKNKIMQNVMLEYKEFDKFALLAGQDKIVLAYSLANAHPMYKESKIYKAMEERWKKAFILAEKYSLDPKGMDKAREILAPYRGISDKTRVMQDLFTQGEVYKRFRVAIGQKNFKIAFELIKQNSFLKEFPEYEMLMNYGDSLYMKAQTLIHNGDTHAAIKILRILADFSDFTQEVKELMVDIDIRQKFFKAVKEKDIAVAYNLLANSENLQNTEDGRILQKQWNNDLSIAESCSVEGDVQGVRKALEKYMAISSKYMSLGTIFGWCYMVQLEQAVHQKRDKFTIENGIKNYVLNFGLQDQILSFFEIFIKQYKDSKLNLELLTKGSLSMWRPSMVVDSILD